MTENRPPHKDCTSESGCRCVIDGNGIWRTTYDEYTCNECDQLNGLRVKNFLDENEHNWPNKEAEIEFIKLHLPEQFEGLINSLQKLIEYEQTHKQNSPHWLVTSRGDIETAKMCIRDAMGAYSKKGMRFILEEGRKELEKGFDCELTEKEKELDELKKKVKSLEDLRGSLEKGKEILRSK